MSKPHHQLIQKIIKSHKIPSLPIFSAIKAADNNEDFFFPIHRVYCIGQNYREHSIEMGHDPNREPPFFFMKPPDAATTSSHIPYPPMTSNCHYEGELVIAIGKSGFNIPSENVRDYIFGYAVGCDITRRDLQKQAKQAGRAWCVAKGFDNSAPCGAILPKEESTFDFLGLSSSSPSTTDDDTTNSCQLTLKINHEIRQQSPLNQMIWDIPELISHLSKFNVLQPGDLIFSGTPAGVGPFEVGDSVVISCGDLPACEFQIGPPISVRTNE